jgi:hypothetical protein
MKTKQEMDMDTLAGMMARDMTLEQAAKRLGWRWSRVVGLWALICAGVGAQAQ